MEDIVKFFEGVPDGSRLEVSFGPENGPIACSVLFITSGKADQFWSDLDVRPGPKTQPLAKGHAYMLELNLAFFAQAAATIDTRIFDPQGALFSSPRSWPVDGGSNANEQRILLIRMA